MQQPMCASMRCSHQRLKQACRRRRPFLAMKMACSKIDVDLKLHLFVLGLFGCWLCFSSASPPGLFGFFFGSLLIDSFLHAFGLEVEVSAGVFGKVLRDGLGIGDHSLGIPLKRRALSAGGYDTRFCRRVGVAH